MLQTVHLINCHGFIKGLSGNLISDLPSSLNYKENVFAVPVTAITNNGLNSFPLTPKSKILSKKRSVQGGEIFHDGNFVIIFFHSKLPEKVDLSFGSRFMCVHELVIFRS
jgi:hypothetical protein